MIKGFSITDEGSLIDAKAAKAAGYEFAYARARKTVADVVQMLEKIYTHLGGK
jgi:hypothetical protein